jgi:hypothetical protein
MTLDAATLRFAADIARQHKTEIISPGKPDPIIDPYVDGVLKGYRDAVQQIAEALDREAEAAEVQP